MSIALPVSAAEPAGADETTGTDASTDAAGYCVALNPEAVPPVDVYECPTQPSSAP